MNSHESPIDYTFIKRNIGKRNKLETIDILEIDCIELIDQNVNLPEGAISFSPMIPYKSGNKFEVWMTIASPHPVKEIRFIMENKNDQLVVINYEYSDYCIY